MPPSRTKQIEFGDFQTPLELAREVCALIRRQGFLPRTILEPTCGQGNFIRAALEAFPAAKRVLGIEYNSEYVLSARASLSSTKDTHLQILEGDFFDQKWGELIRELADPILILGNPPWVTNAVLGSLQSKNLPPKQNIDSLRGLDAITGKANFDISEWMLRENLKWLSNLDGMLAVLCKTSVARKVLKYAWSQGMPIGLAAIYRIDAKKYFNASVDACLFCVRTSCATAGRECADYDSLDSKKPKSCFGYRDEELVADVDLYERWRHLRRPGLSGWRSGIKHDCSKVFELDERDGEWVNGLGEQVDVEEETLFPLLKSSDLAAGRTARKKIFVPQKSMSESPEILQHTSPKAWEYLCKHSTLLARRSSSIYKKRPPFSIFGVGPYSFAHWKVGISGFYKTLQFVPIGPMDGKPTLLDDTCYLFPCDSQEECELLVTLCGSKVATEFFQSLIFWDAKRPIMARLLNMLDLETLASELNWQSHHARALSQRQITDYSPDQNQQLLFR